jgi:hypothetical protein
VPVIFVLDVPEFAALVEHARTREGYRVSGPAQGYYRISAAGRLSFERKALGFKPAVWHGALTGGLLGRIERFDNDLMILVDQ